MTKYRVTFTQTCEIVVETSRPIEQVEAIAQDTDPEFDGWETGPWEVDVDEVSGDTPADHGLKDDTIVHIADSEEVPGEHHP